VLLLRWGFAPYHDGPVLPDSRQACFVAFLVYICHVVSSSYSNLTCLTCFPFCFVYPPDSFKDFKSELHRLFPLIHDTKFIAFEIRRNPVSYVRNKKSDGSSLNHALKRQLCFTCRLYHNVISLMIRT